MLISRSLLRATTERALPSGRLAHVSVSRPLLLIRRSLLLISRSLLPDMQACFDVYAYLRQDLDYAIVECRGQPLHPNLSTLNSKP